MVSGLKTVVQERSTSGTSGIGVVVIKGIIDRKRNRAEVEGVKANTKSVSIANSIKMENLAFERYVSTEEKLKAVEQLLAEVRRELEAEREYILILRKYIKDNGYEPPEHPNFD